MPETYINYGQHRFAEYDVHSHNYYRRIPIETYWVLVTTADNYDSPQERLVNLYRNITSHSEGRHTGATPKTKNNFVADLLVLKINSSGSHKNMLHLAQTVYIVNRMFYICRFCIACHLYMLINLPQTRIRKGLNFLKVLLKRLKMDRGKMKAPYFLAADYSIDFEPLICFGTCKTQNLWYPGFASNPMDFVVGSAYWAEEFGRIMFGNRTFYRDHVNKLRRFSRKCRMSTEYKTRPTSKWSEYPVLDITVGRLLHDLLLSDRNRNYRFMLCSNTQDQEMSFGTLFHAFDWMTWMAIVGTYFITMILLIHILLSFLTRIPQFIRRDNIMLLNYGILLEQSASDIRGNIRCIYGPVILLSVVLSNAYRGENLNNLISPPTLFFYNSLDEVMANSVTLKQHEYLQIMRHLDNASPPALSIEKIDYLKSRLITMSDEELMLEYFSEKCQSDIVLYAPEDLAFLLARKTYNKSGIDIPLILEKNNPSASFFLSSTFKTFFEDYIMMNNIF